MELGGFTPDSDTSIVIDGNVITIKGAVLSPAELLIEGAKVGGSTLKAGNEIDGYVATKEGDGWTYGEEGDADKVTMPIEARRSSLNPIIWSPIWSIVTSSLPAMSLI